MIKNKSLNITILTVVITVSLQFLFIRFASYGIEKVDYGNFVLLQSLVAGLSAIFLQIPGQSFDRFYNNTENKTVFINEFRTLLIFINILSIVVIFIYSQFIERFSFLTLSLVFIYFILLNNYALNQKIFLLNMQRGKYFYLKVLDASSRFLFPIIFYFYFQTLESLFIGIAIGYLISYIVLITFLKEYRFKIIINIKNLQKYFKYAYPIMFVSCFTWGISFSDRYFIDYYLSTEDVAIYSLLAMVANVGAIIGQIYFIYAEPKILKKYEEDKDETFKLINSYIIKLILVFSILSLIAFILPKIIYTVLLEKEIVYNDYYFSTMIILLIAMFFNILHVAHHMHLKLLKRLDILAYILLVAFIVNIIGNLFIKDYGIIAAAYSTIASYLAILFLQIFFVSKIKKKVNYDYL